MKPLRYRVRTCTEPDASEWTESYAEAARECLYRRKSEKYAADIIVEVEVLDLEQEALQAKPDPKDAVAKCLKQIDLADTLSQADRIMDEAWEEYRQSLQVEANKAKVIDWYEVSIGVRCVDDPKPQRDWPKVVHGFTLIHDSMWNNCENV